MAHGTTQHISAHTDSIMVANPTDSKDDLAGIGHQ